MEPIRSETPRRKSDFITASWVQGWAIKVLWAIVGALVIGVGMAWTLSASVQKTVSDLTHRIETIEGIRPQLDRIEHNQQATKEQVDSIRIIIQDRERR